MFDSVDALLSEHAQLQDRLADPDVHADQALARRLGRRYAQLNAVAEAHRSWLTLTQDLQAARELGEDDAEFAAEVPELEQAQAQAEERLIRRLIPRDEHDARDVILEVKGGSGGEEAALFAADLVRMYTRYAEARGWKTEILSATASDLGGYRDVQVSVRSSAQDPAEGVWAHLKFEGGVHRVQRVPETESQGRIHTSAAAVLVLPEVDEPEELEIRQNDLKIDVYRSSGPGGQSVNTTDSAVRITHLPTGIVVAMQNEKSQLQNREAAMRVLRSRLLAHQQEQIDAENAEARKSQVRTMDRSERIRTYNYPENRIADHRTGYKAYNLDVVLDGGLDAVLESCRAMDEAERLAALAETSAETSSEASVAPGAEA
ncbi:peptide chain release factor 1 [Nesterenkonia aerolata]|uniref:Peptide chain release factor 1 n=1 Tax=Nesterenkonia aerolata TaxID=3074079 RepID=A0ABU2DT96_9MICC|nr:peptide chain release factor 1 [Nesterenkonia sp. LY-0111]MDR8019510.1 peptide chain release factor 1 [Nesterenkonia sp. LY-0111]